MQKRLSLFHMCEISMENQYPIQRRELIDWLACSVGDGSVVRFGGGRLTIVDKLRAAICLPAPPKRRRRRLLLSCACHNWCLARHFHSIPFQSNNVSTCSRTRTGGTNDRNYILMCSRFVVIKRQSIQVNGLRWYINRIINHQTNIFSLTRCRSISCTRCGGGGSLKESWLSMGLCRRCFD